MTSKEFIQKAMDGGWKPVKISREIDVRLEEGYAEENYKVDLKHTVLDPKAWKAVGKVEGWKPCPYEPAHLYMSKMIDELWDGKTVEQYLATL